MSDPIMVVTFTEGEVHDVHGFQSRATAEAYCKGFSAGGCAYGAGGCFGAIWDDDVQEREDLSDELMAEASRAIQRFMK